MDEFDDHLEAGAPSPDATGAVRRFARNAHGRDFVVGDIHGMFRHLDRLLDSVAFDTRVDRVFSVGDLVDRGPDSHLALQWLDRPWFHACRGNHEQFAVDSRDPDQYDLWINHNGGRWWLALDSTEQDRFRLRFENLPFALEVETDSGLVGVIHADVPPFLSWEKFMSLLANGNPDATLYALWSRNRISGSVSTSPVVGDVVRVYCGHTPTRSVVTIDNVHYIDTGAAYAGEGYEDARLTLVEIHPEPHREHHIRTADAA